MITKLVNSARDYAWGSKNLISDFFGTAPTGKPMAEIWYGTHPGSLTKLANEDSTLLDLREQPLTYLLKILAAAQPLSLQAHPNREQAQLGFATENALGLPIDSPDRNYKDDQPKPEMVVALTEFKALCGFREETSSHALLAKLALNASPELALEINHWRDLLAESLQVLFEYLISQRTNLGQICADLVQTAEITRAAAPEFAGSLDLVCELNKIYPGDPGVVISLLMNFVELKPMESLQLPAGNIHAYVSGLAIELMAASDNVLRGGLTQKHIDDVELSKVLSFVGQEQPIVHAKRILNGLFEYPRMAEEFQLYRIEVSGENLLADLELPNGCIAICTAGSVSIFDSQGVTETLALSEVAYLADARLFSFTGNGTLFIATN